MSSDAVAPDSSETAEAQAPAAAQDDVKAKFLAALERKHGTKTDGAGGQNADGSKIHGAHGAAAAKRNFRRKSGG